MSTAVPNYDATWEQGNDFVFQMIYKSGADAGSATPVDLTGYSVRMDISDGSTRIYTFNSADVTDISPTDTTHEATVGSDGSINITVPRSVSLTGGAIFTALAAGKSVFLFDIFLRNTAGKQTKILAGTITVNKSTTLWLA